MALNDQFHPVKAILSGSHAYGSPRPDSDVDLLVVVDSGMSPSRTARKIREAWRPLRRQTPAFDLIVESPGRHEAKIRESAGFYDEIVQKGVVLI